ncbi:putative ribose-5-phosphate isomerase [Helianthus anomalus]
MSQKNSDHHPLKFVAGADAFGCALKDTLVSHLRSLNIPVEDLGTDNHYSIGAKIGQIVSSGDNSGTEIRGLLACGTGVGVSIFANKFPGVYAATCLTPADAVNARSINNANVIAFSGISATPNAAVETLDNFLNTPFKSPCPASNSEPWPENIQSFLDKSLTEMPKIGTTNPNPNFSNSCVICDLASGREFTPVEIMPGGSMKIVRESPTAAVVRFTGGSVEPAHHHRYGHDVVVMKGRKIVWNLSKNERGELGVGDYLYTPGGDVHRVKYLEDTEFFIRWDGGWDIMLDEDLATALTDLDQEC